MTTIGKKRGSQKQLSRERKRVPLAMSPLRHRHLKRILVVKLAGIGDLLTATPAFRALRRSLPDAHIAALVSPDSVEVLRDSPLVNELIVFEKTRYDRLSGAANPLSLARATRLFATLRQSEYDAVVVMHHLVTWWGTVKYALLAVASGARYRVGLDNGRGIFLTDRAPDGGFGHVHEVDYWLATASLLGATTADRRLEVTVSPEDLAVANEHLTPIPRVGPIVAIHAGSGDYSTLRRWDPARFAEVAAALAKRYAAQIVLVGGPDEVGLAREVASALTREPVNLAGKTSIKQLAAILGQCDLFIGNDSGVMHLAVAAGTRVVAIFGPSNHRAWGPYFPSSPASGNGVNPPGAGLVVRVDLPCSPCLYRNPRKGKSLPCSDAPCLKQVTSSMVIDAAEQLLDNRMATGGSQVGQSLAQMGDVLG